MYFTSLIPTRVFCLHVAYCKILVLPIKLISLDISTLYNKNQQDALFTFSLFQ